MYSFNDLNSIFIISEKDVENDETFKFMFDHKYIVIQCKIDFHGIECIGQFTYVSSGKLTYIELIPTNEYISYYTDNDIYPDEKYEIASRNKVEPILNSIYGDKIKVSDPWIGDDGYIWPSDKYNIRINKTCISNNEQGGKIYISLKG